MIIEIDISGQIQQKNYDSALGFRRSDGLTGSIFLRKSLKKSINQKYKGQIINLIEKLHCILIYYCIKDHLNNVHEIRVCRDIDQRIVSNLLPKLFSDDKKFFKIKITFIGGKNEKSKCHNPALKSFRHRKYADRIISLRMIEDILFKFK